MGMRGRIKPYSQRLSDKHDPRSREAAIEHFKTWGINLRHNPQGCEQDLLFDDGTPLEVEMKCAWSGSPVWPYPTIHFLIRKTKYIDKKLIMMWISNDCKYAMLLREYHIRDCPEKPAPNYLNPDEVVLDVPVERGTVIKLRRFT